MSVLLLAETSNGHLVEDGVARALSGLGALGAVDVLVCGAECAQAADEAARLEGVAKVLLAQDPALAHGLAEPVAAVVTSLAGGYTHIAAASSAYARNVLPRIAAMLGVMVLSDVTVVKDADTFERPIYAGNAVQRVRSDDPVKVFTLRTATMAAVGHNDRPVPVSAVSVPADPGLSAWVADRIITSERPELTAAKVVVSGGRGLGSEENFSKIAQLADRLGGAVGASRAAVDAGYAPNDWQVGQTGKVVAPDLYLAIGISGAIQHLAGMKDSRVIVAINRDEDAPIFQVADYGLVGDLFTVLPELTAKL